MKIEHIPNLSNISSARRKNNKKTDSNFASFLDEDSQTSSPSDVSLNNIIPSNPLLSLQEAGENVTDKKRKAFKNATEMLGYMEDMRKEILMGSISRSRLEDINKLVNEQRQNFNDAKLDSILEEIEIRAAVELEKLNKTSF